MRGDVQSFQSIGLNPDFHDKKSMREALQQTFESVNINVKQLIIYGSGASSPNRKRLLMESLKERFPSTEVLIEHDLLAAARATLGHKAGLAGILGTGSNCCRFDGEKIIEEYRSGGYIIGDEGGGVFLGKLIIKAFIEDRMESDLREQFEADYQLDTDGILESIYKKPFPNKFLASFAKFAAKNRSHPSINDMIEKNFRAFFETQLLRFREVTELELGLVGSVAHHFEDEIRKISRDYNIHTGKIIQQPINALLAYHRAMIESEK